MKKIIVPALAVGLAVGAGLTLRHLSVDMSGKAIGEGGVDALDVFRVYTGGDWAFAMMPAEVIADAAVFAQATSHRYTEAGTVRFDAGSVRYQAVDGSTEGEEAIEVLALRGDLRNLGVPAEIGSVVASIDGHDTRLPLEFDYDYQNPVVFAQVASSAGNHPLSVYVDNVSGIDAELVINEPPSYDGSHANETIHYAVIEAGTYALGDGRVLEVGTQAVTTTGAGDLHGFSTTTAWYDDAAFVTTIQDVDRPGYVTTRVEKGGTGHDIQRRFKVRFARAAAEEGTPTQGTIGYLALGTPWALTEGRIEVYDGDNSRGWDFAKMPHSSCINLDAAGFADRIDRAVFTSHHGRTTLTLYKDRNCTGDRNTVSAYGTEDKSYGDFAGKADSMRISWAKADKVTETGTWFEEEVIVENNSAVLMLKDGSLTLYKKSEADDSMWPVWSKGNGNGVKVKWKANGNFTVIKENGDNAWGAGTDGMSIGEIKLTNDCNIEIYNANGNKQWGAGTADCNKGAPPPTNVPGYGATIGYTDLDRDDEDELVLMVNYSDGTGGIFYDPLSVAEMLTTLGIGIPDDFWTLLSPTQQAILLIQMAATNPGDTVEAAELEAVIAALNEADADRQYDAIRYEQRAATSSEVYSGSDSVGPYQGTVTVGEYQVMVETDEYGPGFEMSYTHAQVEIDNGIYSVSASAFSGSAAYNIDKNGYTCGAQFTVVGVAYALGNTNGSYVGFDAGVGAGAWADVAAGRNGQYGFSLGVPVVPVGVSIYVKGDDAEMVYNAMVDWNVGVGNDVAALSEQAWAATAGWVSGANSDMIVAFEDTAEDARVLVNKTGALGEMIVGNTSTVVMATINDPGGTLNAGLDVIQGGLTSDALRDGFGDWADANESVVKSIYGGAVNAAKSVYKKLKFW